MKLAMVALVGIFAIMSLAGCGGGGDSIETRANSFADALSDLDAKRIWDHCIPEWRDDNSWDEFKEDVAESREEAEDLKVSIVDIEVDSGGEFAKVTYKAEIADVSGEENSFDWVKLEGKWYVDCPSL